MWEPFLHDSTNYLLKVEDDGIKISITDLKSLWTEEIKRNNLVQRFKELNTLYNGNDENTYAEALKIIKDVTSIVDVKLSDSQCHVQIKSRLVNLPIHMDYVLLKAEPESFFDEVTVPLMKTVQFLELKKNKLIELMTKKDKEIMEYNLEYGEISRKTIITNKYEKDKEDIGNDLMLNIFTKSDDFYKNLAEKHGDILVAHPELKEIKPEKRKLSLPKEKRSKKKRA